ncbi:hypothetical protein DFH08DRAFT_654935, partial [Mycena albidolilacea]
GFPLYCPRPQINLPAQYQQRGVAIGDVGTVTVEGDFDFFFNIYLSANDNINVNVPADLFLGVSYESQSHAHSFMHSSTVGGELVFECAGPHGPVLALPHGAHLQKLENLVSMEHHAVKYAQSWYKYVRETRGCKLQNGSLLLITGCEKARSWGIASFHHLSLQHKFQLLF